jgi:undecaprenyl-diphosphatase
LNRYAAVGLVFLAAALALGLAAVGGLTKSFDVSLLRMLAFQRGASDGAVAVARWVTTLGNPDIRSLFITGFIALFAWQRRWRAAIGYVATIAITIAGYSIMKEVLDRARPTLSPWFDDPVNMAYPSGHAAGAAIILILGALLARKKWLVTTALLLTGTIGLSRVLLGVHWPTDVVGGWLWGGGAALIGYAVIRHYDVKGRR